MKDDETKHGGREIRSYELLSSNISSDGGLLMMKKLTSCEEEFEIITLIPNENRN
jgi:hypothetical protein